MKYLKTFEKKSKNISNVDDIKKLLSHLIEIFTYYGIDYSNYYENRKYETEFHSSGTTLFEVSVDTVLGSHLSIHIFNGDPFYIFLLFYFKNIKELKIDFESNTKIVFDIIGDVDNIIEQITNDDIDSNFKLHNSVNKFNL